MSQPLPSRSRFRTFLRPLLFGVLVVSTRGALVAQKAPAKVAVSPVVERLVAAEQSFVGSVVPSKTSRVGSAVEGRVIEFLVNEGDAVEKNQPLARLRTDMLEIQLGAAEAELTLRREELAELENGSRPEEIAQTQARMLGAKSLMEYSKAKHQRTQSLFSQGGSVSKDQLQEANSAAISAEQQFNNAKALHEMTVRGPRKEKIAQARARVAIQSNRVALIEDQISKHTILAPFDGYVVSEETEVGQWVEKGDLIAEIVRLSEVDVRVYVLDKHAAFLKLETEVRVEVPSLPEDMFHGRVTLIVPRAEDRSRTFPVKIRVKNRIGEGGPLLKAGLLARVSLPIGDKQPMTMVPKDALVLGGRTPVVFVVDADGKKAKVGSVRSVTVELGVAVGTLIQVKGSLKPGDRVVVQGNERITHKQRVSIAKALTVENSQ